MTVTRAEKLIQYLSEVKARRFQPGRHDCALFVSGWVRIATGVDHGARWRRQYHSLAGGQRMLEREGIGSHVELVASILAETAPALAQVGDVAVIEDRALGIFSSDRVFVLHKDGLVHVSRLRAEKAFTV